MKKSNIIVLALSTLLVVCNALPMNNHVENKKEAVISQKEASKKKSKKKDVSKDETNESDKSVNDTSKQIAEENTIQEDQESVKSDVQTQEKTSNQNTNENKTKKSVYRLNVNQQNFVLIDDEQLYEVKLSRVSSSGITDACEVKGAYQKGKTVSITPGRVVLEDNGKWRIVDKAKIEIK